MNPKLFINDYLDSLSTSISLIDADSLTKLSNHVTKTLHVGSTIYICGNGGSAANANHIANDLHFSFLNHYPSPLKVVSLSANVALISCLANDHGYATVYSNQIRAIGSANDSLIVLSGSGQSPNIINAIHAAKEMNIKTISVTGFTGGAAHQLTDISINLPVQDMQIAEDFQLILFHAVIRYINIVLNSKTSTPEPS